MTPDEVDRVWAAAVDSWKQLIDNSEDWKKWYEGCLKSGKCPPPPDERI